MTDNDILAIARELALIGANDQGIYGHALISFARRIQQSERERCAGICESLDGFADPKYCAAAIREQT